MLNAAEKAHLKTLDYWSPLKPLALFYQHELERALARLLRRSRFAFPEGRWLEDGCGRGDFLLTLTRFGAVPARAAALDRDSEGLPAARRRFPATAFAQGDAAALPFRDNVFSFATAATLFSSIPPGANRTRAAAELSRVLTPGGSLLWFDFVESNEKTRGLGIDEVRTLFPDWPATAYHFGLRFGWASLLVNKSLWLAHALAALGIARSHWLILFTKP